MYNALAIARLSAEAADGKKAQDIHMLELGSLTSIADYFIICSGNSSTQVAAISHGIEEALAKAGRYASHMEGTGEARWILMDYGDVVVHIFEEQARAYYSLDKLWGDAPRIPISASTPAPPHEATA